ncbi:MAG: ABC transporter substrate-binding protein, partial [Bauldia sp.]
MAGGAAFIAACGGDESESESGSQQTAPADRSAGAAAPGSVSVNLDAKSKPVSGKESIEELRERFHPQNLKHLPGQKDGPKNGGTLRWSSNPPVSWDLAGPAASLLASYAVFHNGLVSFEMGDMSENLNLVKTQGDLAQSWEQADTMTLTFKLNSGIKWQDVPPVGGRDFTAEDVKYAVEVYQKAPV